MCRYKWPIAIAVGVTILSGIDRSSAQDIETGLIHHWKFDETGQSETAIDSVGGNHLSLGGNHQGDQRWVSGLFGNALEFSIPQHYAISSSPIVLGQYTVTWWSYRKDPYGVNPRIVHEIRVHDYEGEGVGTTNVHSLIPPLFFIWEHYAVTLNFTTNHVDVYKNGVLSATGSENFNGAPTGQWVFAHNQGPGNQNDTFIGLFDDFRVYDRILTPDDVFALYSLGSNTANANDFNVLRGFHVGGQLSDTFDSDNSYLQFRPGLILNSIEPPVWVSLEGTLATDDPSALSFTLEARANTVGLSQTIELFDYNVGAFELVDKRQVTMTDSTVVYEVSDDINRFVEPGSGNVQARLAWKANGPIILFPWTVSIDHIVWEISQD